MKKVNSGNLPKNEAIKAANQWLVKCFAAVCKELNVTDKDITERTHLTVGDPKLWRDVSDVWPFHPARLYALYPAQFSRQWATQLGFTNVDGSYITMNPSTPFREHKDVRYAVIAMVNVIAKLRSIIHKQLDNESGKSRIGVGLDKETRDWLSNWGFSYVDGRLSTSFDGSKADKMVEAIAKDLGKPYAGEVLYATDYKARLAEDGALPKTIKFGCDRCGESLRLSLRQVRLMLDATVSEQVAGKPDKLTVTIPCCYMDAELGTPCGGSLMPEIGGEVDLRDQLARDIKTFRKVQATRRSNKSKPRAEKLGVSTPNSNLNTVTTISDNGHKDDRETIHS